MKTWQDVLINLGKVKSIVTILLTIGFLYLSVIGRITGDQYLDIFTIVMVFYFGTQYQKNKSETKQ